MTVTTEVTLVAVVGEAVDEITAVVEALVVAVVDEVFCRAAVVIELVIEVVITTVVEVSDDDVEIEAAFVEAGTVGVEGGALEEDTAVLCDVLDFVASSADVSYIISVLPLGKLGAAAALVPMIIPLVVVAPPLPLPPPTTVVTTMFGHMALRPFPSKKSPISVFGSTATP